MLLHVTGVPFPQVLGNERPEVGRAQVGDAGGESEETPRLQVPSVRVVLLDLVGRSGQTVLLHGALQEEELAILQVGGAHHF